MTIYWYYFLFCWYHYFLLPGVKSRRSDHYLLMQTTGIDTPKRPSQVRREDGRGTGGGGSGATAWQCGSETGWLCKSSSSQMDPDDPRDGRLAQRAGRRWGRCETPCVPLHAYIKFLTMIVWVCIFCVHACACMCVHVCS